MVLTLLIQLKIYLNCSSTNSTKQNGQTHSNNSSEKAVKLFECVWPFCGVGPKRVKRYFYSDTIFRRVTIQGETGTLPSSSKVNWLCWIPILNSLVSDIIIHVKITWKAALKQISSSGPFSLIYIMDLVMLSFFVKFSLIMMHLQGIN